MTVLDHPLASLDRLPDIEPSEPSTPRPPRFSIRTIKRDLAILTEQQLYYAEIEVSGGANRVTTVDVADFSLPPSVLQVWNSTRSKKKSPQVMVFEELAQAVKELNEKRRLIYRDHTVNLHIYRTIPGSHLEAFITEFTALQTWSNTLLSQVIESHTEAKNRFLRDEIRPLLEAGYFSDEETQQKLALYANRFPKLEQIQVRFGVQMKGPFRMQTWQEALADNEVVQRTLAERERLTADIAIARVQTAEAERQSQALEQEQRAYREAHAYQQRQIRGAIESKVAEVQHQVLNLLYRNLKKLSEKGYQPGKLPSGLKQQLQELAESAAILSHTDQSLSQVVANLEQVNATALVPQAEQDTLREQVDELLHQLESRLSVPELEVVETLGSDDRATWLKW